MNRFIGIPFSSDATPSFSGTNCYGFIQLFYKEHLGIDIPTLDVKAEHSSVVFATFLKEVSEHWLPVEEPELYDVVGMAHDARHPRIVQHFGIYIGNGKVLHTLNIVGSHVSTLDSLGTIIKGYYKWQH